MEFTNEFRNTRNGFCHISKLYIDSKLVSEAKCSYLNRTWESYPFQSVMRKVVNQTIENEILAEKTKRGIKRLTQNLREDIISNSVLIQQLKEKYKTL